MDSSFLCFYSTNRFGNIFIGNKKVYFWSFKYKIKPPEIRKAFEKSCIQLFKTQL